MPVDRLTRLGPRSEAPLATDDLRWLQALARRLARNPAEADDLVQEVWLAAEHATSEPTRSRRAWLSGVLRNRERMLRRSEARRRHREANADPTQAGSSADLELHRQRVLSTLHEVIEELDEDDRALLLSRYCDEHHAPELAERLGLPASTVRSRLSRATARVRQRLDERWGGDRQAWAPAVLAFPSARVGGPAITGTKRYSMTAVGLKIAIAVASLSTAVGLWVGVGRSSGPTEETPASTSTDGTDAEAERAARLAEMKALHEGSPLDRTPATLGGRVIAADTGEPMAGALVMVTARSPGGPAIAPRLLTGTDGSFRLEGLPAGRYTITAAAFGRLPARHEALELAPGEKHEALQLSMATGGNVLEGTITDIGGGPVEGALVQAFRGRMTTEQQQVAYGALTDAEGHYRLTLPDGRWALEAGSEDYSPAEASVQLARGPGHADFVLVPGAEIQGRVVERATGRPVAGATVGFSRRTRKGDTHGMDSSEARDTVVTDEHGKFVLRPLPPAEYALHATAPGLATLAAPRVHAAIGESLTDVVVPVDPAFDAAGFVVEKDDPTKGLGGVEVSAMAPGHHIRHIAVTEPDGYFELHGLLPGNHIIMLAGGGAIGSGLENRLQIEAADRDDVVFELARATTVRGRVEPLVAGTVRVAGRKRHGGLEIMLANMKLTGATTTIAADGTFDIPSVPPGEWKVVVEGEDGGKGELEITVTEAGLEDVVVSVLPRAHVAGVVLDDKGAPLAGLTVRLEGEPDPRMPPGPFSRANVLGTAVTTTEGTFVVYGVEPGNHGVVVVDGREQPVGLLDPARAKVEVVDRDVDGLELRAALPSGRVAGLVHGPDGEPLADASVVIRAVDADEFSNPFGNDYTPTITDSDGRFVFEGLADREYDLWAHGPDADAQGSMTGVKLGADVTLALEQLAVLHGVVTSAGAPVTRFELDACELGGGHMVLSPNGTFTVERLAAGACHVLVTTDDGAANTTVKLEHGAESRVELEIGAWGSLEGVLVSASDGKPLAGVEVIVRGDSGQREANDRMVDMLLGGGGGDNVTDARGHFTIEGVGPGHGDLELQLGKPMMGRGQTLGHHAFVLEPGQLRDLGTIVALAPVEVPKGEAGSLGLKVEVEWAEGDTVADDTSSRPARVDWIEAGGPAERAGLRVGDRVIAFDGLEEAKLGTPTLIDAFAPTRIQAGREYAVRVERDGAAQAVTIVAGPARE